MKLCDRCRVPGCLLDYGGKACQEARKKYCPDVVFTHVPNFGQADTITGVRVYDINGALAGQQSISLKRTSLNVALLRFTFPLIETEE